MSKSIPGLITSHNAGGAIAKRRIVKFGATDLLVVAAALAADFLMGVTTDIAAAADERVDVVRTGITPVEYGGAVTRGAPLTSDAQGRAVTAAPAAGANVRIIGYAEVSGAAGDIGSVLISPGVMQG
jgi:hypothetical protein